VTRLDLRVRGDAAEQDPRRSQPSRPRRAYRRGSPRLDSEDGASHGNFTGKLVVT
jgi:hypothetical protein